MALQKQKSIEIPLFRKRVIGDCTLLCGDMMKKELPPVDLVVSDVPYKLTSGGNTTGEMGGCFSKDRYDNTGSIVECDIDWSDFMPKIFEFLKPRGHAYIMANNRNVQNMLNSASDAGFNFHNLLVWDKITATPNRWYMKNCEFTGFFYKGKAKYINDCGAKQLIRCPQRDESLHPTEKPAPLMEHYIENSSKVGDIVLDPFMGSGTTGVACANTGRKFIGIEIDPVYFDIACERIEDAYKQRRLM